MTKTKPNYLDDWPALLPHIMHDFSSPLFILNNDTSTLMQWLPELLKGYRLALDHELLKGTIPDRQLREAERGELDTRDSIFRLSRYVELLNEVVKALQTDPATIERCSLTTALEDTLESYPFEPTSDRQCIETHLTTDIQFSLHPLFTDALLFQFIDLFYERRKESNELSIIKIDTKTQEKHHCLRIQSTNSDWTNNRLNYSFNRFAKEREIAPKKEDEKATVRCMPGLALCRLALRQNNGDLTYTVKEGEWAEVVAWFAR